MGIINRASLVTRVTCDPFNCFAALQTFTPESHQGNIHCSTWSPETHFDIWTVFSMWYGSWSCVCVYDIYQIINNSYRARFPLVQNDFSKQAGQYYPPQGVSGLDVCVGVNKSVWLNAAMAWADKWVQLISVLVVIGSGGTLGFEPPRFCYFRVWMWSLFSRLLRKPLYLRRQW